MPVPEQCKCWGAPLPEIFAAWTQRTTAALTESLEKGHAVPPLGPMTKAATMVRALSEKRKGPLMPANRNLGHLCPECPYAEKSDTTQP